MMLCGLWLGIRISLHMANGPGGVPILTVLLAFGSKPGAGDNDTSSCLASPFVPSPAAMLPDDCQTTSAG